MEKVAFKMYLKPGCEEEYKRRHEEIWPALKALLKESGLSDYSIFWDKELNLLFAVQRTEGEGSQALGDNAIVKEWWTYMADLMETHTDHSPLSKSLELLFHMD